MADLNDDPRYQASLATHRELSAAFDRSFRAALRTQLDDPAQDFFIYRYLGPDDDQHGYLPALMTADPRLLEGNFWISCGIAHDYPQAPEAWTTFMSGSVVYDNGSPVGMNVDPWELRLHPSLGPTARDADVLAAMCIAATKTWIVRAAGATR